MTTGRKAIGVLLILALLFIAACGLFFFVKDFQDRCLYVLRDIVPFERWRLEDEFYARLVESYSEKNAARESVDLVLLGDSHIEFFDTSEVIGSETLNRGIHGDTTHGVIKRYDRNIAYLDFDTIVILIGSNDMKFRTNEEIIENLRSIIKKSEGSRVIIQSLFPLKSQRRFFNRRIVHLNESFCAVAAEMGVEYLNLHPLFLNDKGTGFKEELTYDGTHLSEEGYRKWYRELNEYLR